MLFAITDGSSVQDKVKALRQHPAVELAEPDYLYKRTALAPNDAYFSAAPHFAGMWFLQKVAAPGGWVTTTGSPTVKVCMIDTGVRRTHQDLQANLAGGWNRAVRADGTQPAVNTTEYFDFFDSSGHGSHTAGTVGAVGNNSVGITGVNWQVSLWICASESPPDADGNQWFYNSALADCYSLCQAQGVRVVSASYGGPGYSSATAAQIEALGQAGALLVAAAGNEATDNDAVPSYPASYVTPSGNVISVAASLPSDDLSSFSNWGATSVDLAAPGVTVLSTYYSSDSSYVYMSGTSMATPIVSGAAALLFAAKPSATLQEVKQALLSSVDPVPALAGRVLTGGRLNIERALAALLGNPLPSAPAQQYVFTQKADVGYSFYFGYCQRLLYTAASGADCMADCQESSWCYFASFHK
ncbi:hypothetical protein ABPG75_011344 [Micractinium tetrahymenae]